MQTRQYRAPQLRTHACTSWTLLSTIGLGDCEEIGGEFVDQSSSSSLTSPPRPPPTSLENIEPKSGAPPAPMPMDSICFCISSRSSLAASGNTTRRQVQHHRLQQGLRETGCLVDCEGMLAPTHTDYLPTAYRM